MFLRSSTDERITLLITTEMLTCEILSSMHHVLKIPSSANNIFVPDLFPLPSTNNVTYVHARVANLMGSFYELSTLKLMYTGCTAAYICYTLSDGLFPSRNYRLM